MSETATTYSVTSRVFVYPFARQPQGEEVVIGRVDTGTFVALPTEAVEVLDDLAAGRSVEEAQALYQQRHGEIPDVLPLLDYLASKGLVSPYVDQEAGGQAVAEPRPKQRYHFEHFPEKLAQKIVGPQTLFVVKIVALAALAAVIWQPAVIPGSDVVYFAEDRALKILIISLFSYSTLFLHEMGHLVAARALGVKSRMGISNRLWVLVAETDLSGLWSVPKEKRYLPLLAGPILDTFSAGLLILFLVGYPHFLGTLPPMLLEILRAMLFVYLMRLLWQCFFFVRTDFYYVFTTYFDCKNLMQDVRAWIRNRFARVFTRLRVTDQSTIPERERKVIGYYAVFWMVGRMLALLIFFTVSLPVAAKYLEGIFRTFREGYRAAPYAFLDALAVTIFSFVPLILGIVIWSRSIFFRKRSKS